jgi:pentatricopeptide repeat domain-containing protein 1
LRFMRVAFVVVLVLAHNPSLSSQCERCGEPDRAVEVLSSMRKRGRAPNTITYNTVISALGKAGRYDDVVRLHREMQKAGVPDDVFTLTGILTACERSEGKWRRAAEVFENFSQRGVSPNTVAYNQFISTMGASGKWDLAMSAFEEMKAKVKEARDEQARDAAASRQRSSSNDKNINNNRNNNSNSSIPKPDVITFGALISALERGGQWRLALGVFDEMQASGVKPSVQVYTSVLNACERGGQWDRAAGLFAQLEAQQKQRAAAGAGLGGDGGGIGADAATMLARKALYAFPGLVTGVPPTLLNAARAAVEGGRAARRWINGRRKQAKADGPM